MAITTQAMVDNSVAQRIAAALAKVLPAALAKVLPAALATYFKANPIATAMPILNAQPLEGTLLYNPAYPNEGNPPIRISATGFSFITVDILTRRPAQGLTGVLYKRSGNAWIAGPQLENWQAINAAIFALTPTEINQGAELVCKVAPVSDDSFAEVYVVAQAKSVNTTVPTPPQPLVDTTPPALATNIKVVREAHPNFPGDYRWKMTWDAPSDATSFDSDVNNGQQAETTSVKVRYFYGLSLDTPYVARVRTRDAAGNVSDYALKAFNSNEVAA